MLRNRTVLVGLAVAILLSSISEANAQRRGHRGPSRPTRGPSINLGALRINIPSPVVRTAPPLRFYYAPPSGYVLVRIGGITYYRVGSVYYRQLPYQDRVVYVQAQPTTSADTVPVLPAPAAVPAAVPVQASTTNLSESLEKIVIDGKVYYRPKETPPVERSRPQPGADNVVQSHHSTPRPEIGTTVDKLPRAAIAKLVGATTYYVENNSYYLPIQVGATAKFVVVENPFR